MPLRDSVCLYYYPYAYLVFERFCMPALLQWCLPYLWNILYTCIITLMLTLPLRDSVCLHYYTDAYLIFERFCMPALLHWCLPCLWEILSSSAVQPQFSLCLHTASPSQRFCHSALLLEPSALPTPPPPAQSLWPPAHPINHETK